MRILPDSYALIEFFKASKKGEQVKKHLKKGEVILSPICIYEILYNIARYHSKKMAEEFHRSLKTHYEIVPVDEDIAVLAADIRRKNKMPMADCLIYATAKKSRAKVISGCSHFRSLKKERDVIIL
jgi:predicted nucleic acid-binding protein